jgi:ParB/RepB/Spo0J family partition protein
VTAQIQSVSIDRLYPHPDNPRLRLRDDVVTQIAAEITRSGFGPEHALLVRPKGDGYEILSGHHRHEAAKRVGLAEVPAWVREMDDDEAFMTLILANTQGELSPLEEGHHVHYYVERSAGGRGKTGGISEYARRLNKPQSVLSMKRAAFAVYEKSSHVDGFSGDEYRHLYEISKAPEGAWGPLAATLVAKKWTVKDTARAVSEVAKFKIPAEHAPWLPTAHVTDAYLTNERPTPTAVARLVEEADRVLAAIAAEEVAAEQDEAEFRAWLVANTGGESWDHRKISGYHADLIKAWSDRRDQADGGRIRIHESRAADLIQHVEPGSVDLIFTDPPYPVEFVECWTELGELAVKALKPGGLLVAYTGQYTMPEALDRLRDAGLSYYWCYAVAHDGAFFRMNATHVQCGWKPLLVMRNGAGDLPNWHKDFVADGSREKSKTAAGGEFAGGEWQQSEAEAAYWISELSKADELVVDPFVGSGTTAAVCKELGRRFIGCDIDPKAVDNARERVVG